MGNLTWGRDGNDKPPRADGSWASNSEFTLLPGSPRIVEKVSVPRALEADGCLRLFLKAGGPGFCRECAKGVPEAFLSYL